jgi:TPR repeat protein
MDWRNDQAATLYYVEAIDAGNPENKVDFRDEVWQWAPFDQNASLLLKPNNAFLGYLGNATTAIAFDEWYDTRNTKPIYSIRQMPLKIPK